MAFCRGGMSAVRHIWLQITPVIESAVDQVTKVTKVIKDLKEGPIGSLADMIPGVGNVLPWINTGLDIVTGVADVVKTLEEKLNEYLGTSVSEYDRNGKILKIASAAVGVADTESGAEHKGEAFYDSAVQLHVITELAAEKKHAA